MENYRDVPMDFADASLIALAEERKITEVFTLDRRGFTTYRIHSRKIFTIYPEETHQIPFRSTPIEFGKIGLTAVFDLV
jgi:hypothetical protein